MNFEVNFILIKLFLLNLNKVSSFSTTRSYDLQVPGSNPIRIIEAEPLWDRSQDDARLVTTQPPWSDVEHRALKPIKAQLFDRADSAESEEDEVTETNEDSAEELKEFLRSYAAQMKRTTKPPKIKPKDDEPLHQVKLITKPSEEFANRLSESEIADRLVLDKSKGWNVLNVERHKHPGDGKNGWVSLEIVPWSVSKVAKWHSSAIKPNIDRVDVLNKYSHRPDLEESPWENKYSNYNPKPSHVKQQNRPNNYQPTQFDYSGGQSIKKQSNTPVTSNNFGQKVYIQQPDYTDEIPNPTWNKNQQNTYVQTDDYDDQNFDQDPSPGIITDGLPANFPKPQSNTNRRKGSSTSVEHPPTHPFNGNGEWVLLTTTKGFKPPNKTNKQRSLDPDNESDPESINSRKSVRLTVLPPTKESKINMTTSHGGLLQVESTFQTVEESQKQSVKKKHPPKRRPQKQPLRYGNLKANIQQTQTANRKGPDASMVLAAVGAGMIPATMAMLVPMAMGKRRRRRRRDLSLNSTHNLEVEVQLQKYLQ